MPSDKLDELFKMQQALNMRIVALQIRDGNEQRMLDSQIRLYDINWKLISLGFSKPELFEVLNDSKPVDPTIEQRYLQLWLNQLCLVDAFKRSRIFKKDVGESLKLRHRPSRHDDHGEHASPLAEGGKPLYGMAPAVGQAPTAARGRWRRPWPGSRLPPR